MAKVIFGSYSSVLVPRQDRDSIRKFYCDVLGGKIVKAATRGFGNDVMADGDWVGAGPSPFAQAVLTPRPRKRPVSGNVDPSSSRL